VEFALARAKINSITHEANPKNATKDGDSVAPPAGCGID